jgi:flagellar hook assembly protein FlgD
MNIGFNRIYWDGRDADGDEIANGIYFYKIISQLDNKTKVITEKLAKVK